MLYCSCSSIILKLIIMISMINMSYSNHLSPGRLNNVALISRCLVLGTALGYRISVREFFCCTAFIEWWSWEWCYYSHQIDEKDTLGEGWLAWRVATVNDMTATVEARGLMLATSQVQLQLKVTCLSPTVWDPERLSPWNHPAVQNHSQIPKKQRDKTLL